MNEKYDPDALRKGKSDEVLVKEIREEAKKIRQEHAAHPPHEGEHIFGRRHDDLSNRAALLDRLKKQRLILQGRDSVVFEGDFLDIYDNFFVLSNVVITGRHHVARPAWTLVDRKSISHIHPIGPVEKLKEK